MTRSSFRGCFSAAFAGVLFLLAGLPVHAGGGVANPPTSGQISTALGYTPASTTGALTLDNLACLTTTGIKDCGVAPKNTFQATSVWSNNTNAVGAPADNTVLTLASGSCSAPTYSFNVDPATGLTRVNTDSLTLCGKGNAVAQFTGVASPLYSLLFSNAASGGTALISTVGASAPLTVQSGGSMFINPTGATKLDYGGSHGGVWTASAPFWFNNGISIGGQTLTFTTGEVALSKIAASGTAPGAAGGKVALVCGTNAGTAKIIAYAGTSTTPVTIIDNIGTGVTGC